MPSATGTAAWLALRAESAIASCCWAALAPVGEAAGAGVGTAAAAWAAESPAAASAVAVVGLRGAAGRVTSGATWPAVSFASFRRPAPLFWSTAVTESLQVA